MPLTSFTYVSSAVYPFTPAQLAELLRVSRRNNVEAGITGLLLYKGGNFMQAIEGEANAVDQLHDRILADPRHRGFLTLLKRPIEQREFPDWSMGFQDLSDPALNRETGLSDFLDTSMSLEKVAANSSRALRLLHSFRTRM